MNFRTSTLDAPRTSLRRRSTAPHKSHLQQSSEESVLAPPRVVAASQAAGLTGAWGPTHVTTPAVRAIPGVRADGWVWEAIRGPLLSLSVHVLIILLVAHWWVPAERSRPRTALVMATAEPSLPLEELAPTDFHSTMMTLDAQAASSSQPKFTSVTVGMDSQLVDHLASPGPLLPTTEVAAVVAGIRSGQGNGNGGGSGALGGGAGGQGTGEQGDAKRGDYGADFFGIRAGGRRFVFVVDSSRSMSGRRWVQACQELLRTIGEFSEEQSFYVIFFDSKARPMFTNRVQKDLLPATDANRTKLRRWMSSIALGSDTFPAGAMLRALQLKPDAVFLLSDGEFNDATARLLRARNHRRDENGDFQAIIPVHTIGFHSRVCQASLKPLAEENGGTYRFVPNPRDRKLTRVRP